MGTQKVLSPSKESVLSKAALRMLIEIPFRTLSETCKRETPGIEPGASSLYRRALPMS